MSNHINIGDKKVGSGEPCFIIAEIAQGHDGSLGIAHSYIDAVAKAGADAIKFQTHIAHAESSIDEPFRVKFSYEDATRYDYWQRMEFTESQWLGLAQHCKDVGLIFLSSPFSIEAVEMLSQIGMPAWKVGSGEVNNPLILDKMIDTGSPILLSSGMSGWGEVDESVSSIKSKSHPLALFQCTSKYPTPLTDVGLNVLEEMEAKYDIPIGLSDHSGVIFPSLAAIARKVSLLEVHVVFDRAMFGPDAKSSITLDELQQIVEFRDNLNIMDQNPVNKDCMAHELSGMRALFNKSIFLDKDVVEGSILTKEMLTLKKPGTGLLGSKIDDCVNKKVNKNLSKGYMLQWNDLEGNDEE